VIEPEKPRRPSRVVVLVVGFWVAGTVLQSAFGWLIGSAGLAQPEIAFRVGQALGWGLLCVISFLYRVRIDAWLRALESE
jgi:hypothetical protein